MTLINKTDLLKKSFSQFPLKRENSEGYPLVLKNAVSGYLKDFFIFGNSFQPEKPSALNCVEVQFVGDYDSVSGKYKIPISVSNGKKEQIIDIFIDEPLRKVGDVADYIDLKNQKIVRRISAKRVFSEHSSRFELYQYGKSLGFYIYDFMDDLYDRPIALSNYESNFGWETSQLGTTMWLGVSTKVFYWVGICSCLNLSTISEIKQWLGERNVMIYWQSKKAIYEDVKLPKIPIYKGENIISALTSVKPNNFSSEYIKKV